MIIWNPTRRSSLPWEGPREGSYWEGIRAETPLDQLSPDFIAFQFMTGPPTHLLILLSFGSWLVQPSNPLPLKQNDFWQIRLLALEEFACIDRFKVPMIWIQNKNSVFVNTCEPQSVKQSDDVLWCPSYLLLVQKISLIKSDITISTNTQSNLLNDYKMLRSG